MNQNIEKLIKLSGDSNCYQYLSLILIFFLWANTYILSVTLPLLERPPLVTFNDTNITVPINYTICEWNNYTITEHFNYSWVSEFHIYCDKTKTGLLGSISSFGFMSGSFLFSFVSKVVSHKTNIMISLSLFIVFIISMTLFKYYWSVLCFVVLGNLLANFVNYSSMVISIESASKEKRSIFAGFITIGFTFSAVIYVPLFLWLQKWEIIFYIMCGFSFLIGVNVLIFLYNSPRKYFADKDSKNLVKVLRGIAKFNGRLETFEEKMKTEEYEEIIKSLSEEKEEKKEEKEKITAIALFKYPSIRYKFLIFCFLFFVTSGIYNGISIGIKNLEGNIYINTTLLYLFEAISYIVSALLMNSKLGRKITIISMYSISAVCLITNEIFQFKNPIITLIINLIFRFFLSGAYTCYYTYTLENYPTPIRTLAFGLNSSCGNFGGLLIPMIIEWVKPRVMLVCYAGLCIVDAILVMFLKETVGLPMEETIEEIEKMKGNTLIPKGVDISNGDETI